MLSGWETLPKSLSTYAPDLDGLFWLITTLMGIAFVISFIALIYVILASARKEGKKAQYISGETGKQLAFIYAPLVLFVMFDMVIDLSTATVWTKIKTQLPAKEVQVKAIAQQWAWSFVQEGDIVTVNELHIPAGKTVHIDMESVDVLHSLSIPVLRFKQDVIPGRIITGWVKSNSFADAKQAKTEMETATNAAIAAGATNVYTLPTDTAGTASFDIQCTEMCGVGHGIMAARVIIHSEADYATWVAEKKEELAEANEE